MINPERVTEILIDCLFLEEELADGKPIDESKMVVVDGIMSKMGLHKGRLEGHREEVVGMLGELPDEFMSDKGGGMSFLHACNTKTGEQWTGMHKVMDELFSLGQALGECE